MPHRARIALTVAVLAGVVSGCGAHHSGPPATSADTTPPPAAAGTTLETPGYTVTATGADALQLDAASDPAPAVQDYLSAGPAGVNVRLAGGGQPDTPVTLSFDFRGKPAPAGPGQLPAVVAVSEGAPAPEVLPSHWDPDTQTLTAKTDHLSGFFPFVLDLGKLATQMTNALNGYLGLSSAKPGCVGQPLAVDDTTYTLDPPTVPPAWPCLSASGEKISVDLASNSPMGWIVRSEPATDDQGPELAPDIGQAIDLAAYHTLFAAAVGDGTLLLPGGTTHLRFATAGPPQQIGLRADPGVTLLNGLMLSLNAMFPSSKVLAIPGVIDCLKPLTTALSGSDPSGTDVGARLRPMIDCVTSTATAMEGKPAPANPLAWAANIAAKSLGAVLSLGPAVANQLAATVGGFVGELTGANTQTITVRASSPPASPPPPTASPDPVIDRVDVTTWAYDRVEGDTYVADNTGGKTLTVYWKAFAGSKQVRSDCTSTVQISGPGAAETKNEDGCDSYDPGTYLKLRSPGSYTVTVTVRQTGHPDVTAQRTVTLLPHR